MTSFYKIFEKLIYSRLCKHICTNKILTKEQYGFRINRCTEAASNDVINEILKAMNNRLPVGGIFCVLKKAFDCVNLEILVDKLQFYGIKGKFLALIQSYLRGRYEKVLTDKFNAYDDVSSGCRKITNGVPQVLILGPLLFLIYINGLKTELCVLCNMDTHPTTVKKCHKNAILFSCPLNHFLWHNFLGQFQ